MVRRKLVSFCCVAVTALGWSLVVGAQQSGELRRVGILMPLAKSDPEAQRRIAVFKEALRALGWSEGQTIVFDIRYADAKPERLPAIAVELVQANVEVIVTQAAQPVEAARKATDTIPIVMASVGDAVGGGYVESLGSPWAQRDWPNTCGNRAKRQALGTDQRDLSEPHSRRRTLEPGRFRPSSAAAGNAARSRPTGDHAAIASDTKR